MPTSASMPSKSNPLSKQTRGQVCSTDGAEDAGANAGLPWVITDDLPEQIPVTPEEIVLFQAYFGDVLDELLASHRR
jgi:hypothetical protein